MTSLIRVWWCQLFHGGDIKRDNWGRINWQCRDCGRWSDHPVSLEDEEQMTSRAIAVWLEKDNC